MVRDGVASTAGWIWPHFLPGHAPDLNPVELLRVRRKRLVFANRVSFAGAVLATATSVLNREVN